MTYANIMRKNPIFLCISKKSRTFAIDMKKNVLFILAACAVLVACNKPSRVEQYRAEKHERDSVALIDQQRTLAYYQSQLETLMPVVDSLLPLFKYEKNEKYQDHGFYVSTGRNELRVMVRDDGQELLMYRNGKRINEADDAAVDRAQHLRIVILDIRELEKRIKKTSLEVQKYQKRLEKQ